MEAPDINLDPPDDPAWMYHDEDCECNDCLKAIEFQPSYSHILELVANMVKEIKNG